jgi:lambda family phage portal protein
MTMTWIDKILAVFSPSAALRRVQNRAAIDIISSRNYDAAGHGQRTKNWKPQSWGPNTEIQAANIQLRNKSRELTRNNSYHSKALRVIPSNVIGTGIQPMIKSSSGVQKRLRQAWTDWAENTSCDFDERKTFYKIQNLAFRSMLESGEVFIRKITSKDANEIGLQLQVLEADFLDTLKDGVADKNGSYIRQGIKFSKSGKRLAYFLFEQHPGEYRIVKSPVSIEVPAKDIIHLFAEDRPGQIRGVPFGTSAMLRIRDFDEYEDAQLIRQKIAACFSVFITSQEHGLPTTTGTDGGYDLERVEPGMIERLKPGEQVAFGSPPPTEGYEGYSRKVLQGIAAGYGTTYEALTGDLSNVNFSSGRMGHIEFQRLVEEWQEQLLIPILCKKVWQWFYEHAILKKVITSTAKVVTTWTAPRREFVDPNKEIKALTDQVRSGFISWQEAVRSLGYNPDDILQQMSEDHQQFEKLGLKPYSDPVYDTNRPLPEMPPAVAPTAAAA